MLDAIRSDPKACRQFLVLVHLYSRTDMSALALLRRRLIKPRVSAAQVRADRCRKVHDIAIGVQYIKDHSMG